MEDHKGNQRGAQNQGKHQKYQKITRKLKDKKYGIFAHIDHAGTLAHIDHAGM